MVAIIFLFLFARGCYDFGYSEEAIKTEMELKGYLQWYGEVISIFNIPSQVSDEALQETIENLCDDTNNSCKEIKEGYTVYQDVMGMKNLADKFTKVLLISNKIGK